MKNIYNPKASPVKIINPEDFRGDFLTRALGLDLLKDDLKRVTGTYEDPDSKEVIQRMRVYATSDEDELHTRIEIFKFLNQHNVKLPSTIGVRSITDDGIPVSNSDFYSKYLREEIDLYEYNKYKHVNNKLRHLPKGNSDRFEEFRKQLSRVDEMIELENDIASIVKEVTTNSGECAGICTVKVRAQPDVDCHCDILNLDIDVSDIAGVGIAHINKKFNFKNFHIPSVIKRVIPNALATRVERKVTGRKRGEFYRDKLISDVDLKRISNYITKTLRKLFSSSNGHETVIRRLVDGEFIDTVIPNRLLSSTCMLRGKHPTGSGERRLKDLYTSHYPIEFSIIYEIRPDKIILKFNGFPSTTRPEYSSFDTEHVGSSVKKRFQELKSGYVRTRSHNFNELEIGIMNLFRNDPSSGSLVYIDNDPKLFGDVFVKHLPVLHRQELISTKLKVIREWKEYINLNIIFLMGYVTIVQHFRSRFSKFNLKMPTLVRGGKKRLTFKNLLPVHLDGEVNTSTGKKNTLKNIKPITSLDSFGSNLVILTGQNAGGKSVALETILNTTLLAHCGIPIFGDSFQFNVRDSVGICFLSRGSGSTMQLQSQKIANILRAFRDTDDPDKCLAIIDELGTGTTQQNSMYTPAGGYGFGTKILSACRDYDTILSTQITDLAVFAEKEFDAISYMFDDEHNISIGIGKPDLNNLIKETGLDEFIY
jgi:hypothetical protein